VRITSLAPLCGALLCATLAAQTSQRQPTFVVRVDLVHTDLIARNQRDQFVADLEPREFEVFEDGVKQEVAWLTLSHGGRVRDLLTPPAAAPEGLMFRRIGPSPAHRDASS
jgi:hypothetical protein